MFTKKGIIGIVKGQLALDMSCEVKELGNQKAIVKEKHYLAGRRVYDNDKCLLKIICFEGQVIINTEQPMRDWCQNTYEKAGGAWFFEYENLRKMDTKLQEYGHEIADVHHYYIPNAHVEEVVVPLTEVRWYEAADIAQFEDDERFEEAFAFDPSHPDVLGVAALVDGEIAGVAGASADSETMWQIGVDVVPEYRGRGIASNLVALLKQEIVKRGRVPFYGTIESHIASQAVAIKAGFLPAWAELYSRKM